LEIIIKEPWGMSEPRKSLSNQGCQMFFFKPKIPIRVSFLWPEIGKCLNILWPFGIPIWLTFGIFYDHWVHFVSIWYIFSIFGIMHQDKSGNPVSNSLSSSGGEIPQTGE
jgi:hypothetical protein